MYKRALQKGAFPLALPPQRPIDWPDPVGSAGRPLLLGGAPSPREAVLRPLARIGHEGAVPFVSETKGTTGSASADRSGLWSEREEEDYQRNYHEK